VGSSGRSSPAFGLLRQALNIWAILPISNRMFVARKSRRWLTALHRVGLCLPLVLAGFLRAATPPPAEAAPERNNKYLFIVDTSRAMKGLKEPLGKTLGALVFNGLEGWIRNGDTYGVWCFAERLSTEYPMKVWREKDKNFQATQAYSHVSAQEFSKKGHLKNVLPHMFSVIGTIKDVTIIVLTSGDDSVQGTEFDVEIKTALGKVKNDLQRANKPAIIALVARDGKVVKWGVNSPELLVPLPKAPPASPPAIAATPLSVTNATPPQTNTVPVAVRRGQPEPLPTAIATNPAAASALAPENNPPVAPAIAKAPVRPVSQRAPIIMTRETVTSKTWLEPLDGSPPVTTSSNAPAAPTNLPVALAVGGSVATTNPSVVAQPVPQGPPVQKETNANIAVVAVTNPPAPTVAASNLPSSATAQVVAAAAPPMAPMPGVRTGSQAGSGPAVPLPTQPASGSSLPGMILLFSGALCVGLALGLLLMRRSTLRSQPSLITRSMSRARPPTVAKNGAAPIAVPAPAPLTAASPPS
jgi:hypothetical protein